MSVLRADLEGAASLAGAVRREVDEPRSPVVRFGADKPLKLDAGVSLSPFQVAYETYGTLNANKSNAILVCHALSGDQYVLDYGHVYGMRTAVFRQSCIYGPRQFGVEDQGWVAWFAIRALQECPVTIFGDGKQVRDVLFIGDLVEAYVKALANIDAIAGQAFNIGGGPANTLSLLELVALLERRFQRRFPHSFDEWRTGDQRVFISNVSKAEKAFGWIPRTSVADGVNKMVDWLIENEALLTGRRVEEPLAEDSSLCK